MPSCIVRHELFFLAKVAEQAERYYDVINTMKKLVDLNVDLTEEERRLLSVGYKKAFESQRASWSTVYSLEYQSNELNSSYLQKIGSNITDICTDAVSVTEQLIHCACSSIDSVVFYHKMRGDYLRYLSEIKTDKEKIKAAQESLKAYNEGIAIAEEANMAPTHPLMLSLALNRSVLYYDVLGHTDTACHLAKLAFDKAMSQINKLNRKNAYYEDSTSIMRMLKENLVLWTTGEIPEDGIPVVAMPAY